MPLAERTAYARFYSQVQNQQSLVERQREAAGRMELYVHRDKLSPGEAERLIEETGGVRGMMVAKLSNVQNLLDEAAALGVKPTPITEKRRKWVEEYCRLVRS
jgi:hypothetical protein